MAKGKFALFEELELEEIRKRLHNQLISHPMTFSDVSKNIGISPNTLRKFMKAGGPTNMKVVYKILKFFKNSESED